MYLNFKPSCRSLFLLLFIVFSSGFGFAETPLYKDASQTIDARVQDLLARMTLEEKVAQLQAVWLKRQKLETDSGEFSDEFAQEILGLGIGQIARPSENKAPLSPNKTPAQTINFVNASQKWLLENTRLGIPAIFHEEALHGHAALQSTSFPQAIALASTWNPELLNEIYSISGREVRRRGGTQVLTPILDVARDPRWGRIEETMGEDPYLVAAMGVEAIKGFQGDTIGEIPADRVIATLKHLTGHGQPAGGLNIAPAHVGERTLREVFLFPFEAAVKLGGARSVMASYNEIDGIPSHANGKLLNDILRNEWAFEGTVVSDYFAIRELITRHHLTDNDGQAAMLALKAGVDLEMPDGDVFVSVTELVKQGTLDHRFVDVAVARILHEKFLLGLFENPYTEVAGAEEFIGREQHKAVSLQAAEQAMVLLKNDGLLPLNASKLKSIAVIGPHAHEALLGGYSDVPDAPVSILQGVKAYLGSDVKVFHAQGTLITKETWEPGADSIANNSLSKERWHRDEVELASSEDTKGMIKKAVRVAKKADAVLVVVGDNEGSSREGWAETHLGDRTDIALVGEQQALVDALLATGKPVVVLLINGRPLAINSILENAPAVLEGWYLGQETGHAVARVLFGDVNPGGKMPVSVPRSVGHIPAYYNHKPSAKRGYLFDDTTALVPFGFGLSYTSFVYSDLMLEANNAQAGGYVDVSVKVTNSGERAGDEVVQLYIRDTEASLTRPVKELKGFKRISLSAGKSARVTFRLYVNQLGFYDRDMRYVVEPGKIEVMLGSSSADIRQRGTFPIDGETTDVGTAKAFLSDVEVIEL